MFIVQRDPVSSLLDIVGRISHCHRQSRAAQHRPVIVAVSQCHDLFICYTKMPAQILQGTPFIRLYVCDLQVCIIGDQYVQHPLPVIAADLFEPGKSCVPLLLRREHQRYIFHM